MLWAIGHPMHPHLHREFRRYTQQVVIINRYLIHRLMPYPHLLTLRNQIVDFIRIFHSPTCMIEVLQRITKVRRHVERLDTAMYISVRILFYLSHISAVSMGRIKYRCRISQSALLCGKRELIGLIVPTQYRHIFTVFLKRQMIIIPGPVCQEVKGSNGRKIIRQLGIVIISGMVQAIFFRQKTIEKIKPASACPDHVRQFILDNRSLKHDGCSRHVQRQGTHMLLLISLFQINFRNRRNPSLQRSWKETFMKNHVLHGIPVEHGQKRTEMSGMKHGYAIQQQQVLIVSAPVDHKILSGQRRSHPRQNPYLREQVSPTKSQQIRRSQFSQFIFPFTRLHGNFFYLKQQWFHTSTDKTVSRHPDRLHLRSVAHVRSFHSVCSFGYMQAENPFSIRNGIPLLSILIL